MVSRPNFFLSTLSSLASKSVSSAWWGLSFGSGCCMNNFAALPKKVSLPLESDPRKADILIISGAVNNKSAPVLRRLYEQMAYPKWVVAIGDCACGNGRFMNTYAVSGGAELFVPIDLKIPGCPPRPEDIVQGLISLKKRQKDDS